MLRLCIITPFPPKEDGLAVYAEKLVNVLTNKFYIPIYVICEYYDKGNVELDRVTTNLKIYRIWRPKSLLNQFKVWRKIIRLNPNIIDIHYGPTGRYGGLIGEPLAILVTLLRLSRLKVVLTLHSIWLRREAKERALERSRSRFISYIAGVYYWIFMFLFLRLFNLILLVVNFENSPITEIVLRHFRLSPRKIKEIVHGTPSLSYNQEVKLFFKSRLGLLDKNVFLLFGFIRKDKGIDLAIKSVAAMGQNNILLIVGRPITDEDERYLEYLKTLTVQLNLETRVRFDIRFVPEGDLVKYLHAADVLLLPYRRRVGPSGPIALAASFGLPVIAVNDGKFLTNHNYFVWLIDKADEIKLFEAMKQVITNKEVMTNRAIDYALKYNFENIAKEYLSMVLNT
jgi:glycosyltransferase involved in cell wall biosynthesis